MFGKGGDSLGQEVVEAWRGKIVIVYVREPGPTTEPGIALESPTLEGIHDKLFLVGKVPHDEKDWSAGLTAGVRWDEVVHYILFRSADEYRRRMAEAPSAVELTAARRGGGDA